MNTENRCNTCSMFHCFFFSFQPLTCCLIFDLPLHTSGVHHSTYNFGPINLIRTNNNSSLVKFVINVLFSLFSLSLLEYAFMQSLPSVLASACVCAATRGINSPSARRALGDVVRLTRVDPLEVEFAVRHIEIIVAKQAAAMQQQHQEHLKLQYQSNKLPTTCSTEVYQSGNGSDFKDVYF